MRSASSLSHIAATNNTTFSTCKIVNTVMVVSIQRTFVNPIGTLFCPFGFGCFNVFYISLHCFVEITIYLCGVVQFHNANIGKYLL